MGVFDSFSDSPNQIKVEGQEITITFQRTSDSTARISWNIPPPAQGCAAATQAYDGIVITIANNPANYLSTSPKDGSYYTGDPTADFDLNSGSVLDSARVVGAFYNDKTTTFIDITGILPKTPYYVSGYAVDAVARYHREGVHSYSLPTGIQSYATVDSPATHQIQIYSVNPMTTRSPTGLNPALTYNLTLNIGFKQYTVTVNGGDCITYKNMIDALNEQLSLMTNPFKSPSPPKTGVYYVNQSGAYFIWDGNRLVSVPVVVSTDDLLHPVIDSYWLNPMTGNLKIYLSGGWSLVTNIINSATAPTVLSCEDVWYDGSTVRVWEGNHWCDRPTITYSRNPQLPPLLTCNDFWYNSSDKEIFSWNVTLGRWDEALVIYNEQDPNHILSGTFWYNETNLTIVEYDGSDWITVVGTQYVDSDAYGNFPTVSPITGLPLTSFPNGYWYDTRLNILYQRNYSNTEWNTLPFISFPTDPTDRQSCDLWWNSSPSVNDLFVWESFSSMWMPVDHFYNQATDPNTSPILADGTAWVDDSGDIFLIDSVSCVAVNYINSIYDPRIITDGAYWTDGTKYYIYTSDNWVQITNIIVNGSDPYITFTGLLWYDPTTELLKKLGGSWTTTILYTDTSFMPLNGALWFDTVNNIMMMWTGVVWTPTTPLIYVTFVPRTCLNGYDSLLFSTTLTGCSQKFCISSDVTNTLISSLANSVIYLDPVGGGDGVDAGPSYQQLGVGDDGSPDERRMLHNTIRIILGSPSIRIELTKEQLDRCIDNSMLMLRKKSSYAYKKGMFFMDLVPNQQIYILSNRCVGYNKIVDVNTIYRPKSGAFSLAFGSNDNFAFAALQQMYSLGTFDILTFHMTASYMKELDTLFCDRIMFQWKEYSRELKLYQTPQQNQRILLETTIERTEQDLLVDRETSHWIQRWSVAEAKAMLAQIRGKFVTLPGPNGTTQLNSSDLIAQVNDEKTALIDEIESGAMQDLIDVGMRSAFVCG